MCSRSFSRPIALAVLFTAAIVVFGYFLLFLFSVPDLNFEFHPVTGLITEVENVQGSGDLILRPGDRILSIGDLSLNELAAPDAVAIASLVHDQKISLRIQRGGTISPVEWPVNHTDGNTYLLRALQMLPSLLCLAVSIVIFLFVRPRNISILLLMSIFSLLAIWTAARVVAAYNLRWSEGLFRAATWLLVPYILDFAWLFLYAFPSIPKPVIKGFYSFFALLAVLDFSHVLAPYAYQWGATILGMFLPTLGMIHMLRFSDERRDTRIVLISLMLLISLTLILALLGIWFQSQILSTLALIVMIGVPLSYIFSVLRKERSRFEMRANRALVLVSFTVLTSIAFISTDMLVNLLITDLRLALTIELVLSVIFVVLAVSLYPIYDTWALHHLMGIRIPSKELLERFTRQITTSLETSRLARVLCEEIAPSLLIRQMMFLRLDENERLITIAECGTGFIAPPKASDLPVLLELAGRYLPHPARNTLPLPQPFPQVRLVLKLIIDGQLVGITLFGRRDPDDFYSAAEILFLQTMMDQAALALLNIAQAVQLHNLYQANLQRTDTERQALARELHDEVLGPLSVMMMNTGWQPDPESFKGAYKAASDRIRAIIEGLRPSILDYSLVLAIEELTGRMSNLSQHQTQLLNQVAAQEVNYPPEVVMQVYRILQEACQNAILRGKAGQIIIAGTLTANQINLTVSDNGTGFESAGIIDLTMLLRQGHFGLVGIFERADMIKAEVKIVSAPNQGTRISLHWSDPDR